MSLLGFRYTVENDRQPSAMEVWQMISRSIDQNNTINILTNGPLTNIANIILTDENASSIIQVSYVPYLSKHCTMCKDYIIISHAENIYSRWAY